MKNEKGRMENGGAGGGGTAPTTARNGTGREAEGSSAMATALERVSPGKRAEMVSPPTRRPPRTTLRTVPQGYETARTTLVSPPQGYETAVPLIGRVFRG